MSVLTIRLLGPPGAEVDGAPIEVDTRKAIALLAYLATTGRPHRRDSLAALLWPDQDQAHARGALRRTVSVLKRALGGGWVNAEREEVALDRAGTWFDIDRFRELVAETAGHGHGTDEACVRCVPMLEEAAGLHRGDFLEGFSLRDSAGFDDWQFRESESLRRERAAALDRLVRALEAAGRPDEAFPHAEAWLALDPLHEPAHRALMRLYAATGRRSAAVRQYRECVRLLDAELGVPPLEETTELWRSISEGGGTGPPEPAKAEPPARRPPAYPLVGRATELEAMRRAYEAGDSGGVVIGVGGEPGIGKTRLCEEFLAGARAEGAVCIEARCYEGEAALAYGPIVQAVRAAAAARGGSVGLERFPPHVVDEAARLAPELQQPGRAAAGPPVDDPGSHTRFLDGVAAFLFSALEGRRPGILFVDDVQWADAASLDLLAFMSRRLGAARACLVLAWRTPDVSGSHPARRLLAEASRGGRGVLVEPRRLDRDAVGELAGSVEGAPGETADHLFEVTEGLPFFAVEYLEAIRRGSPEALDHTPEDVRALIQSRLAGLSQAGSQVLAAAAVIGRTFDPETVRRASGRSQEETAAALEELSRRGLLREGAGPDGRARFDFDHERVRAVVLEETSLARRLLLHRRVGDALAARTRREPVLAGLAAYHYLQAGREAEAAGAFEEAARHARSLFANREALSHVEAALALGHPDAAKLHEAAGDLRTLLGEYRAALAAYEAAAAVAGPEDIAAIEHKSGNVHHRRGDFEAADRSYAAALAALPEGPASTGRRARILADRSLNAHRAGKPTEAAAQAAEALDLAAAAGDRTASAQAHNIMGILAARRGAREEAGRHLEESLALASQLPDPGARIAAMNNLALVRAGEGRSEEAVELETAALDLCVAYGDRHREAALHNNLADFLHAAGQREEAMDHLKRAVAIFAEIGEEAEATQPEIWKLVEW